MGNIHSVTKSLESLGEEILLIKNFNESKDCKAIILPGVGAFDPAMINLKNTDLINDLKDWIKSGKSFFGICLGMQCACIEFSRNVLGEKNGNSTEFNKNTTYPIIDLMEEQKNIKNKGGTMRLGSYKCTLEKGSLIYKTYKSSDIKERHRHRYEFNNLYKK